jgi:hypothetical protein
MIAELEIKGQVQSASFSPDGKLIALTVAPGTNYPARLSLWDANSGRLLRELWAPQWHSTLQGWPLWWDQGRFILLPMRPFLGPGGIGVWEPATGKFRGTLPGPPIASIEGDRLFQRGLSGEVLEWDADAIRKQIDTPENPPTP